jgi:hypothetical protein
MSHTLIASLRSCGIDRQAELPSTSGVAIMAEMRLSELSAGRQAFIRRCQRLGHGTLRGLEVRDGEPAFGPRTEVFRDLKLDGDKAPRSEQYLNDFVLCKEILQLFATLDSIRDGAIDHIEVRAGVPRRPVIKESE